METYKFFLQDLVALLKEDLEQAKQKKRISNDDFDKGLSMGIYTCLDLIKQQAQAFDIPLSEIGLKDYPLEKFL
jgi:hypothetical protein